MGIINPKHDKHSTYYGIYYCIQHDSGLASEKPQLISGWYSTPEEALDVLKKQYDNGKKKRHDNDFYGHHYTYWYEIYAWNDEVGESPGFYDMSDYVNELLDSGEWYNLSKEQKQLIAACSPVHTQFKLLFEKK